MRRGTDAEAVAMARALLAADGLFVGSSSSMNCVGAVRVAQQLGAWHAARAARQGSGRHTPTAAPEKRCADPDASVCVRAGPGHRIVTARRDLMLCQCLLPCIVSSLAFQRPFPVRYYHNVFRSFATAASAT